MPLYFDIEKEGVVVAAAAGPIWYFTMLLHIHFYLFEHINNEVLCGCSILGKPVEHVKSCIELNNVSVKSL